MRTATAARICAPPSMLAEQMPSTETEKEVLWLICLIAWLLALHCLVLAGLVSSRYALPHLPFLPALSSSAACLPLPSIS